SVESAFLEEQCERRPRDELHHEVQAVLRLARFVHGDGVRVVEGRLEAALAAKAVDELGGGAQLLGEHLESHLSVHILVTCAVDDRHPTPAEDPLDPVAADDRATLDEHRWEFALAPARLYTPAMRVGLSCPSSALLSSLRAARRAGRGVREARR